MKNKLPNKGVFRLFLFIIIIVLGGVESCKKDRLVPSVSQSINSLGDNQKVSANDITAWTSSNLPAQFVPQIQFAKAKQNFIRNQHVVRVPIGKDAALFFTKTNGKLIVFAYKWLNKRPDTKYYTGYITAYSFQTNTAKQFTYQDSKVVKQSYVQVDFQNKRIEPMSGPSAALIPFVIPESNTKIGENYFDNIFAEFWCWLTGGDYITQQDIYDGYYGANGDFSAPGCDYSSVVSSSEAEYPDGDFTFGNGNFSPGDPGDGSTSGGSSNSSGTNYGGGISWVYVENTEGCAVDNNGNQSVADPTDPDNTCSPGYWISFQILQQIDDETSPPSTTDPNDSSWWDDNTTTYPTQILPSYANIYANYPKVVVNGVTEDMPPSQVYALIGGLPLNIYNGNPVANGNACAARVSRALIYSGITIPYIKDKTFQGADGNYYFLAASALYVWMSQTFKSPGSTVITLDQSQGGPNGSNFQSFLSGNKGIYILRPVDPSQNTGFGATGHATIYNGNNCMVTSEGHAGEYFGARGGVKAIRLWVLN